MNHIFKRIAEKSKGLVRNISNALKGIPGMLAAAAGFLAELPGWAEDSLAIYHKKRRMEKRHRETLKRRLSPKDYRRYVRKQRMDMLLKVGAGVLCVGLVVFGTVGVVKLAGRGGKQLKLLLEKRKEARKEASDRNASSGETEITIGCTGCMLLHDSILEGYVDSEGQYDFSEIYQYIAPAYSAPDFMTCEFEGSLPGEDYSGYPTFRSPDAIIENIRDSGVDLQLLATNHVYDGGHQAFQRMLDVYQEKKIPFTGIRRSTGDKPYYIANIRGIPVGFVNYVYETEGEGVDLNTLPLAEEDRERLNTFDYDFLDSFYNEMNKNIQDMKAEGAQFIVANLHWGVEYELQERDVQREIAGKLCNLGVDALIGGHPHCEQPIDVFTGRDGKKMFCAFSVGNALTNQRAELISQMPQGYTEDGVIVMLKLRRDPEGQVSLSDVELLPTWVYRYGEDPYGYYILPLDDMEGLEEKTGLKGIRGDAQASYDRTMEVMGEGLKKAKEAFSAENKASGK